MREFRPMPTTPKAMRHFEKNDKREAKDSQTLSFSQTVSLQPKAEGVGVNTYHLYERRNTPYH